MPCADLACNLIRRVLSITNSENDLKVRIVLLEKALQIGAQLLFGVMDRLQDGDWRKRFIRDCVNHCLRGANSEHVPGGGDER